MSKYRLCWGLAMAPDKDMKMLEKMSAKGWHLTEFKGGMYKFEKGECHEYIYNLNMEPLEVFNDEMLSMYKESGWTPVILQNGCQIFRAEKGTHPIFTDSESKIELFQKNRGSLIKPSIISIIILIIITIMLVIFDSVYWRVAWFLSWFFFVFTVFPLVGFTMLIRKAQKAEKEKA
ncbi:MAG: DUF2812 domain-containing protein [Hominimerdicola sp.]